MKHSALIYGYLVGMFGQAIFFDKWTNISFWFVQIIGLSMMIIVWLFLNKSIFKINKSDKIINTPEKNYSKHCNYPKK